MSAKRFALDQNFPQPIVSVLAAYIPEAELVGVAHNGKEALSLIR